MWPAPGGPVRALRVGGRGLDQRQGVRRGVAEPILGRRPVVGRRRRRRRRQSRHVGPPPAARAAGPVGWPATRPAAAGRPSGGSPPARPGPSPSPALPPAPPRPPARTAWRPPSAPATPSSPWPGAAAVTAIMAAAMKGFTPGRGLVGPSGLWGGVGSPWELGMGSGCLRGDPNARGRRRGKRMAPSPARGRAGTARGGRGARLRHSASGSLARSTGRGVRVRAVAGAGRRSPMTTRPATRLSPPPAPGGPGEGVWGRAGNDLHRQTLHPASPRDYPPVPLRLTRGAVGRVGPDLEERPPLLHVQPRPALHLQRRQFGPVQRQRPLVAPAGQRQVVGPLAGLGREVDGRQPPAGPGRWTRRRPQVGWASSDGVVVVLPPGSRRPAPASRPRPRRPPRLPRPGPSACPSARPHRSCRSYPRTGRPTAARRRTRSPTAGGPSPATPRTPAPVRPSARGTRRPTRPPGRPGRPAWRPAELLGVVVAQEMHDRPRRRPVRLGLSRSRPPGSRSGTPSRSGRRPFFG